MPIRIRKSFTIFPGVKVNVSKGGTSITVGKKGFHLNFSKRGVRETVGLPGSGISETNYLYKKDANDEQKREAKQEESRGETTPRPKRHAEPRARESTWSPWGCLLFLLIAVSLIYLGASALGLLPPHALTSVLQSVTHWARQAGL